MRLELLLALPRRAGQGGGRWHFRCQVPGARCHFKPLGLGSPSQIRYEFCKVLCVGKISLEAVWQVAVAPTPDRDGCSVRQLEGLVHRTVTAWADLRRCCVLRGVVILPTVCREAPELLKPCSCPTPRCACAITHLPQAVSAHLRRGPRRG